MTTTYLLGARRSCGQSFKTITQCPLIFLDSLQTLGGSMGGLSTLPPSKTMTSSSTSLRVNLNWSSGMVISWSSCCCFLNLFLARCFHFFLGRICRLLEDCEQWRHTHRPHLRPPPALTFSPKHRRHHHSSCWVRGTFTGWSRCPGHQEPNKQHQHQQDKFYNKRTGNWYLTK